MSKIDIDILVSLALYGPAEVDDPWWPFHEGYGPTGTEPPVEVATALGAMLWQANADRVLDPEYDDEYEPLSEYTFERVRFPVTAVEGLSLVACYTYQTEGDDWVGSPSAKFCQWLESALIRQVPGYKEAPWGWSASDVDLRFDQVRAAGVSASPDTPAPVAADVTQILNTFRANGVEVEPFIGTDSLPPTLAYDFHTQPSRKIGHWISGNHLNRRQVQVRLYADDEAAHVGYLARRALHEQVCDEYQHPLPDWLRRVQRHGRVVVELARPAAERTEPFQSSMQLTTRAQQETALTQLGEPDEAWSTDNLPILSEGGGGRVLANRVAVPPGYNPGVDVGTDAAGLRRIAALVDDEAARQRILAVDVDREYALMVIGMSHVDKVTPTRMVELASPPGRDPGYRWELTMEGLRWQPAVVIAVDKPPHRPTETVIQRPGAGQTPTRLGVFHQ